MFEDLEAWQQARHLVNEIYSLTRENSSLSKDFGLTTKCKGLLYQSCRTSLKGLNGRISPRKFSSTTLRVVQWAKCARCSDLRTCDETICLMLSQTFQHLPNFYFSSMSTVIEVDDVWKKSRLGIIGTGTLRHDFERWWHRVRGKPDPYSKVDQTANQRTEVRGQKSERGHQSLAAVTAKGYSSDGLPELGDDEMWALRGVSFEVKQGEILGIIGRNGAGKSTLLKILSRVTAPTSGEVRVKGRIASLLEVGTGFHPELTGRENIFLNGAILGMTKAEIRKKFDEIVDFAGVERYMDTPVKRYSSGMYVRLAFAVAAHLEPEILICDEVLAVGDAEFQKKCMGKMQDVSKRGRTILFVSHNMAAVSKLCSQCAFLDGGRLKMIGPTDEIIPHYLKGGKQTEGIRTWDETAENNSDPRLKIHALRIVATRRNHHRPCGYPQTIHRRG